NDWMCPDLQWDDNYVPDRGKVMSKDEIAKLEKFHRYLDVDGDGIPWRTLPGVHPKGAYFTRGPGRTTYGAYTEASADYHTVIEQNRDGQMRALLTLETRVPKEKLRSLLHYSGLPISSEFIVKGVLAEVEPKTRKPEVVPVAGAKASGGVA